MSNTLKNFQNLHGCRCTSLMNTKIQFIISIFHKYICRSGRNKKKKKSGLRCHN